MPLLSNFWSVSNEIRMLRIVFLWDKMLLFIWFPLYYLNYNFTQVWGDHEGEGIGGRDRQGRLCRDRVREEAESAEDDMVRFCDIYRVTRPVDY